MNRKKIFLNDLVDGTSTNANALPFFIELDRALAEEQELEVSFEGCPAPSSSFLNSSIGEVLDSYGYDTFKRYIRLTDLRPTAANILKEYILGFKNMETH